MDSMIRKMLTVGAALFVVCAAAAVILAENGTRIPPQQRHKPDASLAARMARMTASTYEDASVQAPDNITLRAWYLEPFSWNRAAVILLHGVADTREGVTVHATFLLKHGYAVLLPDARGHGESGGECITYGWKERHDVKLWSNWLHAGKHAVRSTDSANRWAQPS